MQSTNYPLTPLTLRGVRGWYYLTNVAQPTVVITLKIKRQNAKDRASQAGGGGDSDVWLTSSFERVSHYCTLPTQKFVYLILQNLNLHGRLLYQMIYYI